MAASATLSAMNGDKALHPFFKKPSNDSEHEQEEAEPEPTPAQDDTKEDQSRPKRSGSGREGRNKGEAGKRTQKTLQEIVNPTASGNEDEARKAIEPAASDSIETKSRHKRRRTSLIESKEVGAGEESSTNIQHHANATADTERTRTSPQVIVPTSTTSSAQPNNPDAAALKTTTPPKKMLRLNASGKFSSPVSSKAPDEGKAPEEPKRRGRKRKSKAAAEERHLWVKLDYEAGSDLGARISRILAGEERYSKPKNTTPKRRKSPPRDPSKPTHPFFTGKAKETPAAPKPPSPQKYSAVGPGRLRRETMIERPLPAEETQTTQDHPVGSRLLKDRFMVKHPGAKEPSWPSREQAHVRGISNGDLHARAVPPAPSSTLPTKRKRKNVEKRMLDDESLLARFTSRLSPEQEGKLRDDGFCEPHPSLRVPQRLLIPGQEILERIAPQLSRSLALSPRVEEAQSNHPVLERMRNHIARDLSAYDEGLGERLGWMHKYAPSTTAEVLQPSGEMENLKEWLTSLTVSAVGSTANVDLKLASKSETKARSKKKRKRKNDEMDDFLVRSDDEAPGMDTLSVVDDTASVDGTLKSVIQTPSDGLKLSNAVLLSGPNGCGKTAAALAVSRECGFKVFEISPCERRSGKDVLDKVGDMTENHLVQHHGTEEEGPATTEDPDKFDEDFQADLASGRQGKMDSFFKFKAPMQAKKSSVKAPALSSKPKERTIEALQQAVKKPTKDQRQSLILLEEVDILFREDKDFWSTVLKLIVTSKRPFIMTCNDEAMVPLQAMSLHAILRLTPPPLDLATDYMLLVAAAEGHLLKREAIASLYESKKRDLRASMGELDLWCQMGIGDPRGGLSWIYQRFPPGSDLDSEGRPLRVASDGTYESGLGICPPAELDDEDQLFMANRELGLDPLDVMGWRDASPTSSLKDLSSLADSLSASDMYSSQRDPPNLDPSQPPLPDKFRAHYIEGSQLLQTDHPADHTHLTTSLSITTTLLAYRTLAAPTAAAPTSHSLNTTLLHPRTPHPYLTRSSFAPLDPIATPTEPTLAPTSTTSLQLSALDGPLKPLATDIAPYVRTIARHDLSLAAQRARDKGVTGGKRARSTRAARSAGDGEGRGRARREWWFEGFGEGGAGLEGVLATGGRGWGELGLERAERVGGDDGESERSRSAEAEMEVTGEGDQGL